LLLSTTIELYNVTYVFRSDYLIIRKYLKK